MKTGTAPPDDLSPVRKTFILTFMAIVWRRVWITASIYADHNKLNLSKDIILKSLKFNVFSPSGIGGTIKPYIKKALIDGFLMPHYSNENIYVARAINMFKPAHDIVMNGSRVDEIKFIKDYAMSVFNIQTEKMNEVSDETKDILNLNVETNDSTTYSDLDTDSTSDSDSADNASDIPLLVSPRSVCDCKMCSLVNDWDINVDMLCLGVKAEDDFQSVIAKGLVMALE